MHTTLSQLSLSIHLRAVSGKCIVPSPCPQASHPMCSRPQFNALAVAALSLLASGTFSLAQPSFTAVPQLPADVPISKGAGRGGYLTVMLHLEHGAEFPCVLDTGSPGSLLPKTVESRLGKRLRTQTVRTLGGPREKTRVYATPKLYLGTTPLLTGKTIAAWNDHSGVLGMDCLSHYCIQLDFQAGKIRFLNPESVNPNDLGKSFPLTSTRYACIRHRTLFGQKTAPLLLDTGLPFDAMISTKAYHRAVIEQDAQPIPLLKDGKPAGTAPDLACFPSCLWEGTTYTNLVVGPGRPDLLGLRFLARHTVTFNFPKRVMYLKATSPNPLPPEPQW